MGFEIDIIGVISVMIAIEYMDHAMEKRYNGIWRHLLFGGWCAVYYIVMSVLNKTLRFEGIMGLAYGIVLILYGVIALKGNFNQIVILGGSWVFIAMVSTYMTMEAAGLMTGMGLADLNAYLEIDNVLWMYAAMAAAILKFSMGRVILTMYKKEWGLGSAEDGVIAGIFFIFFLVVLGIFQMEMRWINNEKREWLSLWVLGGILAIILLMGFFYRRMEKYQREQREKEYREKQLEMQKEQIHDLYMACREVNHFRHDMSGKLDVLYRLLRKEKYDEASEYIKGMGEELETCLEIPQDTGNEGLNAALMKAAQKCKEEDIEFHYVVFGKPKKIDNMDMGRLVWGLLENGIEACQKMRGAMEKREIEVVVRELDEITEIQINNSIGESVLRNNFSLKSQKSEKLRHGFGMESIHDLIEKYYGNYICREEEGRFIQKIIIKN